MNESINEMKLNFVTGNFQPEIPLQSNVLFAFLFYNQSYLPCSELSPISRAILPVTSINLVGLGPNV